MRVYIMTWCTCDKYQSKKDGKDQESIQSSTTPDPEYHMGKRQNHTKNYQKQEQRGQLFLAGDHKAVMNRRESMTNTRQK